MEGGQGSDLTLVLTTESLLVLVAFAKSIAIDLSNLGALNLFPFSSDISGHSMLNLTHFFYFTVVSVSNNSTGSRIPPYLCQCEFVSFCSSFFLVE